MAKQHLYSRVPARGSLYNRADGFDTFAHSEGLSREFVERELSAVYENKLAKQDAEAVRTGQMPVVYSQSCLRSGALVQSCVSYLPKDYTGERSAYLCHSLILSDAEQKMLFGGKDFAVLNPQMFISDANTFDFVSQIADTQYPEKNYIPAKAVDPKELIDRYDGGVVKSFLFALLSMLCAKGKTVYFKMPCGDDVVSIQALKLLDMFVSVIPYHLRKGISFVTYVTDPAQYSHVKVKCVCADCPENLLNKGLFVDFGTGLVTGMPAADVVGKMPVNFFYSLLEDAAIRNEFLTFVEKAVQALPELEKMNTKTLSDLVFLFGGASGLYDQDKVLPTDDDVLTFLSSYEKYRAALGEESRRNAYKCLERYPRQHMAIPKNIFAKLSRMYGAESAAVKRIVMNVVLELIHTDVMRDKLFTFLKNNYNEETAEMQKKINADICRVFYGGFLQAQILDFFSQHFASAPVETQDMIFDKLMLTIRTASVQEKILAFIAAHYNIFTDGQKKRLYETIYEMLPECDGLTAVLVQRLNAQMEIENDSCQEQVAKMLAALLAADYKKDENKLMPILVAEPGFCRDVVSQLAFGPWSTKKIYEDYISVLCAQATVEKTGQIARILAVTPGEKTEELLTTCLEGVYKNDVEKTGLYVWLDADTLAKTEITPYSTAVAEQLRTRITQKAILCRLNDVLNVKLRKDGLQQISQYAKDNPYLRECETYKAIATLRQLIEAAESGDVVNAFCRLAALLQTEGAHSQMAEYLEEMLLNWETQTVEGALLCQICCNALRNNAFFSEDMYAQVKVRYTQLLRVEEPKLSGTKLAVAVANKAAELLLRFLVIAAKADPSLMRIIKNDENSLENFLQAFCADYGRNADKCVLSKLEKAPTLLHNMVVGALETIKPQKNGLFGMLFGKK